MIAELFLEYGHPMNPIGRIKSRCHARLFVVRGGPLRLVLLTEIEENPGPSITNSIEWAMSAAAIAFGVDPNNTNFVEHYNHQRFGEPETFDLVHADWNGAQAHHVYWDRITKTAVEDMIGEKLN